jgi:hypothetical protein
MAIGLYFYLLSNYRNIEYRIGEFKKLSDYRISDQGLNLSDYRISDSEKTIGCPPLPRTYSHSISLKVPKREIFDRSDFPDFYTIKSLRVGDFRVK